MKKFILLTLLLNGACASGPKAVDSGEISNAHVANFLLPAYTIHDALRRESIWSTGYVVWLTKEDKTSGSIPFLDKRARHLGVRLSQAEWCRSAMEGTAYVQMENGSVRTFNYAGMLPDKVTDCSNIFPSAAPEKIAMVSRSAFFEVPDDAKYGLGAKIEYRLVPYRSIAVDRNTFDLGSVLYIPKLRGTSIELPDGRQVVHDGYVVAVDTGGMIRDKQIDFFKGPNRNDAPPATIRSTQDRLLDAYIVTDPELKEYLLRPHQRFVGS
ncbi:3D domain-containing protein [Azospirillum argentinense]